MNTKCPGCRAGSPSVVRNGRFYRADDARYIQRFKCRACGCGFSAATGTLACRQKKRRINASLRKLLCGQTTQREAARLADHLALYLDFFNERLLGTVR